jgi:hypothetical protein
MGIDDGLQIIPGVTKLMCSVFAEHGINPDISHYLAGD